jgi:hypothetical protein
MNYFRVMDDVHLKYKTLSCRSRCRDILSGQLKCHKEYFSILNVLTAVTIKEEDCYRLDGTLCNVAEISELSGDPAISKSRVGRRKFRLIWGWEQQNPLKHWYICNTLHLAEFCKTALFKGYIDWECFRNASLCGTPIISVTEGLSYQFKGLGYKAMLISYRRTLIWTFHNPN